MPPTVVPHLIPSVNEVTPGESFDIYILLDLAEGWHVYWEYPGDSGFPPSIQWKLPEGWSAGPLEFSLPEQFSEPGEMTVYGYKKCALFKTTITPPTSLKKGASWKIDATISWLACSKLCVPGSKQISLSLGPTILRSAEERSMAMAFTATNFWPVTTPPPFAVFIQHHEKNYVLSFQAEQGCCYQLFPLPELGTQAGHVVMNQHGRYYEMTVPWEGKAPFKGLLIGKDGMNVRRGWMLPSAALKTNNSQFTILWGNIWAFVIALFSGFLGGFILNLMPCVLPVISLKIFGFIKQAGTSRLKVLHHGLAFITGIYLWFFLLGILVVVLKTFGMQVTWAFQFQNSAFILALNVLIFVFALNLFGVFEINLPGKAGASLDSLASQSGLAGSFFQGLFATLLATPCTAPFLGSALGFAFAQSGVIIMVMFLAVASGMALPYFILSIQPGWMSWLPKPGAWMERMKQFMGFPLLATNLWLLTVLGVGHGFQVVMMVLALLLALALSLWIYGAYHTSRHSLRHGAFFLSITIAIAAIGILVPQILTSPQTLPDEISSSVSKENNSLNWVPYSPSALEQLRLEGKAVFVDFTAAWCLTCQFNERTAINTTAVKKLFREKGIVPMKADWTNSNPEITEFLKSFGRVGVPFYVFYPASKPREKSKPVTFSELLTESQLIKVFSYDKKPSI